MENANYVILTGQIKRITPSPNSHRSLHDVAAMAEGHGAYFDLEHFGHDNQSPTICDVCISVFAPCGGLARHFIQENEVDDRVTVHGHLTFVDNSPAPIIRAFAIRKAGG